ncbi:MAG: NifB/NifX family molybdenum-iron cluster-binding protein [Desulfobacter sp.]
MKIAITAWGNRVSPVFDSARTLLIAEIEEQTIKDKTYVEFRPGDLQELTARLAQMNVSTLICGAISAKPTDTIAESRIRLISFVTGNVMDILKNFASRQTIDPTYMMPGCRR